MVLETLALLTAATLFGGMVVYSFGFAAFVFSALPADQAGTLLRRAFPHYYLFVVGASLAAALLFLPLDGTAAWVLAGSAVLAVYARQDLMGRINAARDAGEKRRFAWLHGWSVVINFVQLAAIGWALSQLLRT